MRMNFYRLLPWLQIFFLFFSRAIFSEEKITRAPPNLSYKKYFIDKQKRTNNQLDTIYNTNNLDDFSTEI